MAEQEEPLLNGGETSGPGKDEEPPPNWYAEGWDVCKLAGPACLQLFFQYIVIVTNQSFAGHIGGNELAAAAIAVTAFNFLWYFLLGLSSAQDTLGSQAFGANNRARVISWAVTTAFCMSVLAVPMAVVLYFGDFLAIYIFQQPQEVADLVAIYCQGMIPGLLPLVWSIVIMKAMQAQNIMWGPTWMTAGMAVANLALNIAGSRLYGFWGVAYAQSAGRIVQFLLLVLYVFIVDNDCVQYDRPCFASAEVQLADGEEALVQPLTQSMDGEAAPKADKPAPPKKTHAEVIAQGFSLKRMGIFLKLGLPGGLMMAADASAFDITTAMAGFLGTVEVGAHTALLTLCVLIYMAVPFGIATAATIRVGNMLGAGKPNAARRTAWLTMGLCAIYSALATVLIAVFHAQVGLIFTTAPKVVALVSKIAFLAAIYQLPDAVYGVFSGVLRGMGRQAQLVGCNIVGFWVVGTATGYTLAFRFHLGVSGLWLGINAGVFTCAIYSSTLLYLVNWRTESAKAQALVAKADAEAAAAAAAALVAVTASAPDEGSQPAVPSTPPALVVADSAAVRPIARPISLEGRPSLQGSLGAEAPVVGSLSSALTGSYIQQLTNRDFASGSFRRV